MNEIKQPATITSIDNTTVRLKFLSCSACSSCSIKGHCNLSESKEKEFIVNTSAASEYKVGEEVSVSISLSQGAKAVVFAYVLPLILMLSTIILSISEGYSETTGGISGIIILIPYYFCIFLLRKRLKKSFQFKISKRTN